MTTKTLTTWGCWSCDATNGPDPDMGKMDRQAENHTKRTGHPTWCDTKPQPPKEHPACHGTSK